MTIHDEAKQLRKEAKFNEVAARNIRACVDMVRMAKEKNLGDHVVQEFYLLLVAAAGDEWGDGTTVDDFSKPGKYIIKNEKYHLEL